MSNAPTVLVGNNPIFRAIVRSATTDTATTVTEDDSGTMFINLSTTGAHTYTLPSVANGAGKYWWFFNGQTSYAFVISDPDSADSIMANDDTSADTLTSPAEVGSWALVIGDGTDYFALVGGGETDMPTWTPA